MIKLSIRSAAAVLALCTASAVMAVPAKKGLMTVTMPDGTEMRVRLSGDESFHQYFTEDGYPLTQRQGEFYYCDITPAGDVVDSGIRATGVSARPASAADFLRGVDLAGLESRLKVREAKARERAASDGPARVRAAADNGNTTPYPQGYGLFPASRGPNFPAYGDQRALVILVEYQDVAFSTSNPYDYFSRMLNEDGFSDLGATGSAAQYFRDNSSDAFRPVFDVYGPVKLSRNRSYYGGNDVWGNDQHPEQMVIEALDALDAEVDFSQYDRDGDGLIDNVFLFFAGVGENAAPIDEAVWPHANQLSSLQEAGHIYDGVEADRYGCTNEWMGTRPDGIGTFVHEFGHILGLPDIYATGYSNAFTPDTWSVMDYGSYNNDGMTPPLYGAFERYALGWMAPRPIDRAVSALLPPVEDNVAGIIRTERDTEFFLIENRQQSGWDTYIPGHGMLVWHIDYNELIWHSNTVNNVGSHQYVDLEEADGRRTEATRDGDSFPGASGVTSFTSSTNPSMTTWNGVPINYPVTDIEETADGMIRFNVLGGNTAEVPAVMLGDATDITATGFTLTWNASEGYDHLVSVFTRGADGSVTYAAGYRARNCGSDSRLRVEGLEPETEYLCTVMASDGWTPGEVSAEKSVTTGRLDLTYFAVTALDATDIGSTGFSANWEALDGAASYLVTVSRRTEGDPYTEGCDFTDGVNPLPAGWESTSTKSYGMASYCGAAAPSLRLGQNGDFLATPAHADGISRISFWMRGNGTDAGCHMLVEGLRGEEWTAVSSLGIETAAGGEVVSQQIPEGVTRVRLRFDSPEEKGSVAIDDVTLEYGAQYDYEPVAGLSPADAGDALTLAVTGLQPDTYYVYTVAATDGTFTSRSSEPVQVRTKAAEGIGAVGADMPLRIAGRTITAAADAAIEVYDVTGRVVTRGTGSVTLPDAGVYIVRLPGSGRSVKHIAH